MNWSTWNPFKPFGRERADVGRILEGILDGSLDCRVWDSFLRIPMKGTPELEQVRIACEALEGEESMDEKGTIKHSERARAEIQRLLAALKEEPISEGSAAPQRAAGPRLNKPGSRE